MFLLYFRFCWVPCHVPAILLRIGDKFLPAAHNNAIRMLDKCTKSQVLLHGRKKSNTALPRDETPRKQSILRPESMMQMQLPATADDSVPPLVSVPFALLALAEPCWVDATFLSQKAWLLVAVLGHPLLSLALYFHHNMVVAMCQRGCRGQSLFSAFLTSSQAHN